MKAALIAASRLPVNSLPPRAALNALTTLRGPLGGFLTPLLPAALSALSAPALAGGILKAAADARVSRRVTVRTDGTPELHPPPIPARRDSPPTPPGTAPLISTPINSASAAPGAAAITALVASIEPRVLMPPLLAAIADAGRGEGGGLLGAPGCALLIRAAAAATSRLTSGALRESLPALTTALLGAFDVRWSRVPSALLVSAGVGGGTSNIAARRSLDAFALEASIIEAEALAWVAALSVRLPERAAGGLIAALCAWASSDPRDDDSIGGRGEELSKSPAVFWAYARLARRIALARVTEALCDVAGAAVAPLLAPLAIEMSIDICVATASSSSSEKTGFTPTERAAFSARGDGAVAASTATTVAAIVASKPKRKRVTFETETEETATTTAVTVDAEMSIAVASSDEEDIKQAKKSTNTLLTASTDTVAVISPLALALTSLKGLDRMWSPNVAHTRIAPFAPYPYVPTTSHGLLCAAAGALRALASADAGADETSSVFFRKSSSSGPGAGAGGVASARERSSVATRALCAILAVPETQASSSAAAAAAAGLPLLATTYAVPLTRALVRALRNDIGWKPLHHALLSLARHERAGARLGAISSLAALHDEAGADALTLLPEALPILAETAHDADARVEAATHALVDALQTASGEDLGSFLV